MPMSLWAPYTLKLALHGNLARTPDSSAYINNLFLGARGARTLQPAATQLLLYKRNVYNHQSCTECSLLILITQLPGPLWSLFRAELGQ